MAKPLNEFGGWLSFFNVIFWIRLSTWFLTIVVNLLAIIRGYSSAPYTLEWVYIIEASVACLIIGWILEIIRVADNTVPNKVLWLTHRYLLLIILFILIECVATRSMREISHNVAPQIWIFVIWMQYLWKSKRVKAYYGVNANLESIRWKFR